MKRATLIKLSSLRYPSHISIFSITSSPFSSSSNSASQSPSPSSSQSSTFIVDYFVRSFGYSRETALKASKPLRHIKSPEKLDSVIAFLRHIGLSQSQLASAVLRRPVILTSNIQSNLLPKINLLQSLGPSRKELADLVASSTTCFGNNFHRRLLPSFNFLRKILQDDKKVRLAIKRCPWILTNDPDKTLSRNFEFLREKGLDLSSISSLVNKSPVILTVSLQQLYSACRTVEEIGLSPKDAYFGDALHVVTSMPKENLWRKLKILRSFGFEDSSVSPLFRWMPSFFRLNDGNVKKKLDFFVNTVGYDPPKLLKYPLHLSLSLERRLLPRYRLICNLQSKGLVPDEVNFAKVFVMSEVSFVNEYVHKFKDEVGLDLLKAYKECTGEF